MSAAIKIAILSDARDLLRGNAQVNAALDKTAKKASTASKAINTGAKLAAGGFVAAGAGAIKLAQGAAEDAKAAALLAKQLQNTTGATKGQVAAVEDWISAQGKAFGVADDQLRPALSALATATGDVGKAQKLASLAMNVSAGTGKSLQTVTDALVRAQNGSVGGLSRLGLATKDASGKTKDFATLQDDLAKKFNGAAAAGAETAEGKMQRFKLALSEAGETLGARMLPVLDKLGTWLNDKVIPALDATFTWMDNHQTTVKVIAAAIGALGAAFIVVAGAMKAYAAVQAVVNAVMAASPVMLVVLAIVALVAALIVAYKKCETFRNIVTAAFTAIKTVVSTVLPPVKTIVTGVFNGIKTYFTTVFAIYKTLFTTAWNVIKTVTSGAFHGVKNLIVKPLSEVVSFIAAVPAKITALGSKFKDAGSAIIGKLVDGLKNAGGFISGIAGSIWNAVKGMINSAIDKINAALDFKIAIPAAPDIHVNAPNIPHLANGGITTGPTLALIGDNPGGREAVIPLDKYDLGGPQRLEVNLRLTADVLDQLQRGKAYHQDITAYTKAGGR